MAQTTAAFQNKKPAPDTLQLYVFLAETCPVCQYYTLALRDLQAQFSGQPLRITGLFPGKLSTAETLAEFQKQYNVLFPLQLDSGQKITRQLNAKVTPEAILVRVATGQVLYRGRIDDSFYAVGKRKARAPQPDLAEAITAAFQGRPILNAETEPVGCLITFQPQSR